MHKKKETDFNHPEWNIESYDLTREFISKFEQFPNNTVFLGNNFNKGFISYDKMVKNITELGGTLLFKSSTYNLGARKAYYFADDKYFIFENIHFRSIEDFSSLEEEETTEPLITIIGNLTILHKEADLADNIKEMVETCFLKTENVPMIGIISRGNSGFFLNEIRMENNVSSELNLHYGEKFTEFHEKLLDRLVDTNKGLSLLHGDPGTGKSSYIRKLIFDLKQRTNKKIIIVPNNLIAFLVDPEFNTFLLETIESYQYDDEFSDEFDEEDTITKGIILILEDAESVLLKREVGDSNQGTSNILNLTDGLLNDIFGIQIIATYNTGDDNIDPAIKRSKRLIAKRNFKKLSIENGKKLAEFIGIDPLLIKTAMSIADIYSLTDSENENILIEKDAGNKPVGFNI